MASLKHRAKAFRQQQRKMRANEIRLSFAEKLEKMGFENYEAYLASDHWNEFKQQYKNSDFPKKCLTCDEWQYQLHHTSYARLGEELISDVIPLCRNCHQKVHDFCKCNNIQLHNVDCILRKLFQWNKPKINIHLKPWFKFINSIKDQEYRQEQKKDKIDRNLGRLFIKIMPFVDIEKLPASIKNEFINATRNLSI